MKKSWPLVLVLLPIVLAVLACSREVVSLEGGKNLSSAIATAAAPTATPSPQWVEWPWPGEGGGAWSDPIGDYVYGRTVETCAIDVKSLEGEITHYDIGTHTLDNGLRVWVTTREEEGKKKCVVYYDANSLTPK